MFDRDFKDLLSVFDAHNVEYCATRLPRSLSRRLDRASKMWTTACPRLPRAAGEWIVPVPNRAGRLFEHG